MGLLDDIIATDVTPTGAETHPADLLRPARLGIDKFTDDELVELTECGPDRFPAMNPRDIVMELAGDLRAMRDHDRIQSAMLDDSPSPEAFDEAVAERDQARADLAIVQETCDTRIELAIAKLRGERDAAIAERNNYKLQALGGRDFALAETLTVVTAERDDLRERLRKAHERITVLENRRQP